MRFLVDENLSPQLCQCLGAKGDSAQHVRQSVGAGAADEDILAYATRNLAVVITAGTDFGELLARQRATQPSVILVRRLLSLPVADQALPLA
jgi:predicted nuclease of predicted toxin-antitoxin system